MFYVVLLLKVFKRSGMKNQAVNIIGRIDGKTGIGQHTRSFFNCLGDDYSINFLDSRPEVSDIKYLKDGVRYFGDYDDALLDAEVSIFTDVTSNGVDDKNWMKVPVTKRKYIYSVFDSTSIPQSWAKIINDNFHAAFVPAKFLIDVFHKSGVKVPVFYLPLALDLSPYLAVSNPQMSERRFRFSFIGSREERKNIDVLIECFNETFGSRNDVELRIHCAIDFYDNSDYGNNLNRRFNNINFSSGVLSDEEYLELIEVTDCFVSLSKGEGYSIVPRQVLASGRPVILSDCFAHAEILKEIALLGEDLAFSVDATIPVPARYNHINGGGVFGVQYDVYKPSVCNVLKKVFDKRSVLFTEEKNNLRKKWACSYDQSALSGLYKSIIQPSFCRMSTGNELEFGGITTNSANLAESISGRNFSLSGWQQISPIEKKVVVIGNDGGFFSVFNRFISYLTWTVSENPNSVVLPDWRISAMQKHWKTSSFTSFCYGKPDDGNIWLKLFKPLPYNEYSEEDYNFDEPLYRNAILKDDFNQDNEPWLTYIHPIKLYKSPGFQRWRHWYHLYFSTYVHLQDHIQKKIDDFYCANLKGYRIISAHIRHPSHVIEQPNGRVPSIDDYCHLIKKIQGEEGMNEHNSKIFLATDQESIISQVKMQFGDMVVCTSDVARVTNSDDAHFYSLSSAEQKKEGHMIQHLVAAKPEKWTTKMAEEVIVDTYLLAKADYFLHITSNIATAVAYINPRVKMIYCE
jgi:glycosyltransferase involved in cell wall biosynthesis